MNLSASGHGTISYTQIWTWQAPRWHLGPVAQTTLACDTISRSDVDVPHTDLHTVVPLLTGSRGWNGEMHQQRDRAIYCYCHHCWEPLCNNCIISSVLKLLWKQFWDKTCLMVKRASEVWCAAYRWETTAWLLSGSRKRLDVRKNKDFVSFLCFHTVSAEEKAAWWFWCICFLLYITRREFLSRYTRYNHGNYRLLWDTTWRKTM